jgi:hypothetical protein
MILILNFSRKEEYDYGDNMELKDHIKSTGGAGREVHIFMDQYYKYFKIDHRIILHHKLALKLIGEKFGPDAIPIAEQHIRDDWMGQIPESFLDRNFYREAWFCDIETYNRIIRIAYTLFSPKE